MCGSHAWNDQRNNSYAYAWTDSRIHPIAGATAAHNSTSSNCSTAQPRYSTGFMCSQASSSPSGEGAMATHNSILALWHLACLHADGPYDSFSSQVREQWQHTIARPATARQPNPGIRPVRAVCCSHFGVIRETPRTLACAGGLCDSSSPCGASCACTHADPMTPLALR